MRFGILLLPLLGASLPSLACAQPNMVTIQLPTFSSFSVSTTVLVPDRGGAAMGGIHRASSGGNQFGPAPLPAGLRNQGIGWEHQASGVQVRVHFHDFAAMEQAMQPSTEPPRGQSATTAHSTRTPTTAPLATEPAEGNHATDLAATRSVADWRQRHAAAASAQQQEVMRLADRAAQAAQNGNLAAAKVYLQMALRRADDERRPLILAELKSLGVQ